MLGNRLNKWGYAWRWWKKILSNSYKGKNKTSCFQIFISSWTLFTRHIFDHFYVNRMESSVVYLLIDTLNSKLYIISSCVDGNIEKKMFCLQCSWYWLGQIIKFLYSHILPSIYYLQIQSLVIIDRWKKTYILIWKLFFPIPEKMK